MSKWLARFASLACAVSSWSKDPTTKVGAVARDDDRLVLGTGYNGPPRGVDDLPERMTREGGEKYLWMAHAEENLVAQAARKVLKGSTVTVTHLCCNACARMLINAGVRRVEVVGMTTSMDPRLAEVARTMFAEAGVEYVTVAEGGHIENA